MVGSAREGVGGIRETIKIVTVATKSTSGGLFACTCIRVVYNQPLLEP